ncbi:MAG: tRNA lysidine(34) synthetase TilS [Steroidobacteraceae bacterium]
MKRALVATVTAAVRAAHAERDFTGLCIALSGGVDSVALLAALGAARKTDRTLARLPLRAVHVHHHLQAAADDWARHCRMLCRSFSVPLTVRHVSVSRVRGTSLEAEARRVRRAAFEQVLRRGEVLLTAHHEDDQLETVLLQLMRGAGVAGLAAMPACAPFGRGWSLRPLLGSSRAELVDFALQAKLDWVEDDSNVDERFDRNYVRRRIVPLLRARWPAAARVAARSTAHLAEARELLGELAAIDLSSLVEGEALALDKLAKLGLARQRNALRAWIAACGASLPDATHLERVRRELPAARADALPVVQWPGGRVRRFRGLLHCDVPQAPPRNLPASMVWDWRRQRALELGEGRGRLRIVADPHGPILRAHLPARLQVRFRNGGERIEVERGAGRQSVKELLRARGVLPWRRDDVPMLCAAHTPLALGDWVVAASLRAGAERRGRVRIEWTGAGRIC